MAWSPNATGDLVLTDYADGRVLRIRTPFALDRNPYEVYASGISYPTNPAFDTAGRLFVTSSVGPSSPVLEVRPDGGTAVLASGFSFPTSVAFQDGALFVSNSGDGTIARLTLDGTVTAVPWGAGVPVGPRGTGVVGEGPG